MNRPEFFCDRMPDRPAFQQRERTSGNTCRHNGPGHRLSRMRPIHWPQASNLPRGNRSPSQRSEKRQRLPRRLAPSTAGREEPVTFDLRRTDSHTDPRLEFRRRYGQMDPRRDAKKHPGRNRRTPGHLPGLSSSPRQPLYEMRVCLRRKQSPDQQTGPGDRKVPRRKMGLKPDSGFIEYWLQEFQRSRHSNASCWPTWLACNRRHGIRIAPEYPASSNRDKTVHSNPMLLPFALGEMNHGVTLDGAFFSAT